MARSIILILGISFVLAGCDQDPRYTTEYATYKQERKLARICHRGTKIWEWRGRYYVPDATQYPDAEVAVPLDAVCS